MRDVAFSCDDNGTPFLRVAVHSLLDKYRGKEPLRINIFEGWGGHSAKSKEIMTAMIARFNAVSAVGPRFSIRYINVESVVAPYMDLIASRENSRWNIFTWTPIFTPLVLDDSVGNVIHFDIDMLFNADISPLFELELGNDLIACVYEYHRCKGKKQSEIWDKGILPPDVERYFNTGVLVFNTQACRVERTWEKILAWYREHYEIADRIEQDAWNALYWNRMHPLSVDWNFHDRAIKNYVKWSLKDKYWLGNIPKECLEAALNPKILHFWGPKKPWKPSHRPYRKLYHAAMEALGMPVPQEEILHAYHDLINRSRLHRIRHRLEVLS